MHTLTWTNAPLPTVNKANQMLQNLPNPTCCRTNDPRHQCPHCAAAQHKAQSTLNADDILAPPPYPPLPVASKDESARQSSDDLMTVPVVDWAEEARLQRAQERKHLW